MDEYYITKEDWDYVMDMTQYPAHMVAKINQIRNHDDKDIDSKVKSGFTRTYNAGNHVNMVGRAEKTFAPRKVSKGTGPSLEDVGVPEKDQDEDENDDEDETDDGIGNDKMIKQKKSKAKGKGKGKAKAKKPAAKKTAPAKKKKKVVIKADYLK
eukprot:TRINITY_DN4295_c0_g1_i11.p2 TRINITY_DN4295_c0_g1~~TRINITY_DN4295_c0_g1_i11.p2  ORF type:complete len:154 (-),score=67.78 TRINITY_DN4295_c0_g1_i11:13-474(-)